MHILGASGHAKVIIDILKENKQVISGIWDDNPSLHSFQGLTIAGTIKDYEKMAAHTAMIAIGNNAIRKQVANKLKSNFGIAIHPKAAISPSVSIAEGTVIMPNSTINSDCIIGKHVIINTNASVDHDCDIQDFAHISPNAALAGNIIVGEGSHIGIGACVIQGIKIGKWVTVGAGAVVIKDVPDYAVVVGNPATIIKYNLEINKKDER